MIHIKNYLNFLNEGNIPSLTVSIEELLELLAETIDVFEMFKIDEDQVKITDDIEKLYENNRFNEKLKKNDLKKGKLEDTTYDETLLNADTSLKFFFIYKKSEMQLEEPKFIILQYNKNNVKSQILSYTNKDSINSFYEKLTDAVVELSNGKETYLYKTTNGGNNWEMKNVQMENDEMKSELDKDQLQALINKKNLKFVK